MVIERTPIWIFLLLLCAFSLEALPTINVAANVQWKSIYENQPIQGTLTITHDLNQKVNPGSVQLEGRPLKVTFVQQTKIAENSPLVIDIYNFEIPGMPKGLQLLPSISVEIDGKRYESTPSTFEVLPGTGSSGPYIKLENIYKGDKTLYPGQRAMIGYRYSYNPSFDLTKEELPLLNADNLKKIGEKEIKNFQSGNLSITEITQFVEAVKPGEFKFGPSTVAGIPYTEDSRGNRTYIKKVVTTEAPALTILVENFPNAGKPASFNGAVGQFDFAVNMLTSKEVRQGDEVKLKMTISGKGQLEKIMPPDLCCQPGFSGLFKDSDLPPVGKVEGNSKTFISTLYPMTQMIQAVPAIEFSWFDPVSKKYEKMSSEPFPLLVKAAPHQMPSLTNEIAMATPIDSLKPLEISGNYLLANLDLHNRIFGSYWVFALLPLGCLFIFFQVAYRQEKEKQGKQTLKRSDELFNEAILAKRDEKTFFALLEKAFTALRAEKGLKSEPEEARQFFEKLNYARFSGKGKVDLTEVILEANTLFNRLKEKE